MRAIAIFPVLCAIAALVLSLLCLLAGAPKSFLPDAQLLTLNTSRLGHTTLFNTSDSDSSFLSSLENDIEGDIDSILSNVTSDIATYLDLHDFYKAHVMNYCEGYYIGNDTNRHAKQNITYCSKRKALFTFDPTAILKHELKSGETLDDLHWPSEIKKGIEALELASKVMFVCYCLGIAFAALAVLSALVGILIDGRILAFLNFLVDILAFIALGIASGIATAIINVAVNKINKYGKEIGIAAYKGAEFLGLTWAAVALMLLASFLWILDCCAGRSHRRRTYAEKGDARY